jgi:hypothetical protein
MITIHLKLLQRLNSQELVYQKPLEKLNNLPGVEEYNKLLQNITIFNKKDTLLKIKKLWNEDKEDLPLFIASKSFPLCAIAKIIVAEFRQNEATADRSVLWNLLSTVVEYELMKNDDADGLYKLYNILKTETPTNVAELWINTLWPKL